MRGHSGRLCVGLPITPNIHVKPTSRFIIRYSQASSVQRILGYHVDCFIFHIGLFAPVIVTVTQTLKLSASDFIIVINHAMNPGQPPAVAVAPRREVSPSCPWHGSHDHTCLPRPKISFADPDNRDPSSLAPGSEDFVHSARGLRLLQSAPPNIIRRPRLPTSNPCTSPPTP